VCGSIVCFFAIFKFLVCTTHQNIANTLQQTLPLALRSGVALSIVLRGVQFLILFS